MKQGFQEEHLVDSNGMPAGGKSVTNNSEINWQNGPLGRGDQRIAPNGAFVEDIIGIVIGRINFYQTAAEGRFKCSYNQAAIGHLQLALQCLDQRTKDREAREVEGTHGQ